LSDFAVIDVERLAFPRSYVLVTSAHRGTTAEVRARAHRIREHVRVWLR
jgi:hypothetical protein